MSETTISEKFELESLPARGSIVVVRSAEIRAEVRRVVLERYGSEIAGRTTVIVIRDSGDTGKLVGAKKPVFLDPDFIKASSPVTLQKVRVLAIGINTRSRKTG